MQVEKTNDGGTIEIKPYTVDGEGANLTLMDALKAAGLPVDGINFVDGEQDDGRADAN